MSQVFFGVQVAVASPGGDPWRESMRDVIRAAQRNQDVMEKRQLYARVAKLLGAAQDRFAYGFWDYIEGPEAGREFNEWTDGIEDDATAGEEPGTGGHVLVSLVFLMPSGSNSATTAGERCDLEEASWLERATFTHLIETVGLLSFSSVRSDAVYLTPGALEAGLSDADLGGEGYDYLKPLS